MVEGLSHITLVVSDLERMTTFLETIFDANVVYSSDDETFSVAPERFLLIGGIWVAVMAGDALPSRTYNHIAFKIPDCEFEAYAERVDRAGAVTREPRPRVEGEGRSLYFYDFDNHLFELHTGTLQQRLERYRSGRRG